MKLLLVEDDPQLAQLLSRGLSEEGHTIDQCRDAAQAKAQAKALDYDVILLDWGLPDLDGLSLLRGWRSQGVTTPVLMLTARAAVAERVAGLRAGADDFVAKPFEFAELLARIEALHRRSHGFATPAFGQVQLDPSTREMVAGAQRASLTHREWQVATMLFEKRGDIVTRAEMLTKVWGADFVGESNIVDVYIGYLRNKLRELEGDVVIATVRSTGYRLEQRKGEP